jgi:hypothetical protein
MLVDIKRKYRAMVWMIGTGLLLIAISVAIPQLFWNKDRTAAGRQLPPFDV